MTTVTIADWIRPDRRERRKLNWDTVAACLNHGLIEALAGRGDLVFRLDGLDLLGHDGLIWLISVAAWRHQQQLGPTSIFLPDNTAQLRYLRDLRFREAWWDAGGQVLNPHFLYSAPPDSRAYSLRQFQLIEPSTWRRVGVSLTTHLVDDIRDHYRDGSDADLSIEGLRPFYTALFELLQNISAYGGPEIGDGAGFACYRTMPFGVLRFCATDLGGGFKESLASQGSIHETDDEALAVGLIWRGLHPQAGVFGLYRVLGLLNSLGGRLTVRSRSAIADMRFRARSGNAAFNHLEGTPSVDWIQRVAQFRRVPDYPGSHVRLDLRLPWAKGD